MKKLFFIAAIASTALVSCTKNELAPSATEQHEISFAAPVVGVQTKAPVYGAIGTDYNTAETFNVWSIWHDTSLQTSDSWAGIPYITCKTATYNGTKGGWAFDPAYYWPAEGYLSFVAISPSTVTATYHATNGFQIENWSQGTSEEAIVDLMYSEESRNHQRATYTATGDNAGEDAMFKYKGVDITFKHALSYLVFNIKTKEDYSATTQFKLNTITLSGVYTTGSFNQKASDPWTENTSGATGSYIAYSSTDGLPFTSTAVAAPAATGKEIILLPQALADEKQKMTIAYQISTDGGSNWIDQTQVVDLYDGSVKSWEMGKKYTYTISISMTEILLDPAVSDWTPETGSSIGL